MQYLSYIEELKSQAIDSINTLDQIKFWLDKYEGKFYEAIRKSECGKWSMWVDDKSTHIFPCACSTRVEDCIFIETYFELKSAIDIIKQDDYYKELLVPYFKIGNNKKAVFEWVRSNELDGEKLLLFKLTVKITISPEPYKLLKINLDASKFKNILEFKKAFQCYYSKEYEDCML